MDRRISEEAYPARAQRRDQLLFLTRYAALAPSSHNTQPWKFRVSGDAVEVHIDDDGWLRVADADRRELHVSAGCALENLLVAAAHYGFACRVDYFPGPAGHMRTAARVAFAPGGANPDPRDNLFPALTTRGTNHRPFDGRPPEARELETLRTMVHEEGTAVVLIEDMEPRREAARLAAEADRLQFADPAWRRELAHWIGRGVFGTPWAMAKLARVVIPRVNLGKGLGEKDANLILSAPVLGVLASTGAGPAAQVATGQALERLWLKAHTLGLSLHPMNQALQIPRTKQAVSETLPLAGRTPQILFRLGRAAPEKKRTPRRDLEKSLLP